MGSGWEAPSVSPPPLPPPPKPKFARGSEIVRNAEHADVSVDFGGRIGVVLCGEGATVERISIRYTDAGEAWFAYSVVGGAFMTGFDVEDLFEAA
jgi:hypothetical protein